MVLPLRDEVQGNSYAAYFLHFKQRLFALLCVRRLRTQQELHRVKTLRKQEQTLDALQWQVLPDEKAQTSRRKASGQRARNTKEPGTGNLLPKSLPGKILHPRYSGDAYS